MIRFFINVIKHQGTGMLVMNQRSMIKCYAYKKSKDE